MEEGGRTYPSSSEVSSRIRGELTHLALQYKGGGVRFYTSSSSVSSKMGSELTIQVLVEGWRGGGELTHLVLQFQYSKVH